LRSFVHEFTETYVYLPGYTDHTIDKICHICSRAFQVPGVKTKYITSIIVISNPVKIIAKDLQTNNPQREGVAPWKDYETQMLKGLLEK
jgi:hypothetical protein